MAALAGFAEAPNTGPVKLIWGGEQERSHRVDCLVVCLVKSRTKELSFRSTPGLYTVEIVRQDCSLNYDTSVLPKAVPASYSRLLSSKCYFLIHNYFLVQLY